MWIPTIAPAVRDALDAGQPVVALESALITHGFPYPENQRITFQMMDTVRSQGAVPAVIGIWRGSPYVGLSADQVAVLAADHQAAKVSVRDLPLMAVRGTHGGTTVAATMHIAHSVGIWVFATGGIGGVHRGNPQDVSADLPMLAQTSIIVVCSGAKAILDLPATLERLETSGVPVVGFATHEFPAFYSRSSGLHVDLSTSCPEEICRIFSVQRAAGLPQSLLVTVPVPEAAEIPSAVIEPLVDSAIAEAEHRGITGRDVTPFLLSRMVQLTHDSARRANESLLVNNARVAAQIACALAVS